MARRAQRPEKPKRSRRIEHPLTVRAWVIPLDPEDIHRELLARLAALDDSIAPSRDLIINLERLVTERTLRQLGLEAIIAEAMNLLDDPTGAPRLRAMMIVVNYFTEHPYKRRVFLPRISVGGSPANPPPDMIHVLDIPTERIREAMAALPPDPAALQTAINEISEKQSGDYEALVALGMQAITVQGLAAIFNPMLQAALFVSLMNAHYAPTVEAASVGAAWATMLFDSLLPDLSQHMSRRSDQLMEMRAKWLEYKQKAENLLSTLRAEGQAARTTKAPHELLGHRVAPRDLSRWSHNNVDADMVANELISRQHRISRKTLSDYRRLWGQAEAIDESWRNFGEYFANLSVEEQRQLVPLAQRVVSPLASSPESPPGK